MEKQYVIQKETGRVGSVIVGNVLYSLPPKYKVTLPNGDVDFWICDSVYKFGETLFDLVNRIVIKTGERNSYTIYTRLQFGKLSMKDLLADIKRGRKVVLGAAWNKHGLDYICQMDAKGNWNFFVKEKQGKE